MLGNFRPFLKYFKPSVTASTQKLHLSSTIMSTKIAVVFSGCGVYDGTELHEASACLVHLSRAKATVSMFAPDVPQMHVIDHTKGAEMEPSRNVLIESARIARGNIKPLSDLNASDFDGVIFPGGFGAAKNLSSWAVDNTNCKVNSDVERVIKSFHKEGKPQGFTCIAPVLAAKCIPEVELTVGHTEEEGGKWPYAGTAGAMEQCGAKHVTKEVTEVHQDKTNNVFSTPAYMCNGDLHDIFDGIGVMVENLVKVAKK